MIYSIEYLVKSIKSAREQKGLSQRALGKKVGLPQSHLSKIENGEVDLKVSSLVEISRALELELILVPTRDLPAVKGLEQSWDSQIRRKDYLNDINKIMLEIRKFQGKVDESELLKNLYQTLSDLQTLDLKTFQEVKLKKELEKLQSELHEVKNNQEKFKEYLSNKSIENISDNLFKLKSFRNSIVHGQDSDDQKPLRAYRLEEEEDYE